MSDKITEDQKRILQDLKKFRHLGVTYRDHLRDPDRPIGFPQAVYPQRDEVLPIGLTALVILLVIGLFAWGVWKLGEVDKRARMDPQEVIFLYE